MVGCDHSGLKECDGVAVRVLEPGRTTDARRSHDVVDRLERLRGIFLELDASADKLSDVLADVC